MSVYGRKRHFMQKEIPLCYLHRTYRPAIALENATRKRSLARIPLVSDKTGSGVCGEAHRVGYRGSGNHQPGDDLAVYRLKVRMNMNTVKARRVMITLPGFFVLKGGSFRPDSIS
jgi:hypothetical protein